MDERGNGGVKMVFGGGEGESGGEGRKGKAFRDFFFGSIV